MLEEALGQASIDLIEYLDKEDKNYRDLTNTSDLIKANDLKLLVHLWVRGTWKHLAEVYQQTECDLLKDALRPILKLPNISKRDL